jgi:hypothetical protein
VSTDGGGRPKRFSPPAIQDVEERRADPVRRRLEVKEKVTMRTRQRHFVLAGLVMAMFASTALAATPVVDFNNDGFGDLAIGSPYATVNGKTHAGSVTVLYGTSTGLSTAVTQLWTKDLASVPGDAESDDTFGYALAAADFGNGSTADLAIGIPYKKVGTVSSAGAVTILYGGNNGLSNTGSQQWSLASPGVASGAMQGDSFGFSLTAANMGYRSTAPRSWRRPPAARIQPSTRSNRSVCGCK